MLMSKVVDVETFGREVIKNQWLSHVSLALNVIALMIIFILATVVVVTSSSKKPENYLVSFDQAKNTFVRIKSINSDVSAMKNLMELQSRQYVKLRETIDLESENERFQEVVLMSNEDVADQFANLMSPKNKKSPLYKYKENNLVREVNIIHSFNMEPLPNAWQVEWQQVIREKDTGVVVDKSEFVTKIAAVLEDKSISYDDRFINVNGFSVTQYLTSKKG